MSNLIEVHKNIFIDPSEVVSVEHDVVKDYCSASISDHSMYEKFNGSKIYLKNGRKIHIDGVMPKTVLEKLGLIKEGRI